MAQLSTNKKYVDVRSDLKRCIVANDMMQGDYIKRMEL
jgi:hypothetical protein